VIEHAIKSEAYLVNRGRREQVSLRDGGVARVIENALVTRERALLGEPRRASWHVRRGLVVTKTREERVVSRNVLVQPDVELTLIQLAHGLTYEVVTECGIKCVGLWVQIDQGLPDGIDQALWNLVAGRSS